jgi:AAA+ superfamily predicted ATPase
MVKLKSKKYSELTTDQLTLLRNKILFRLEDEVEFHISQWEERIEQIKKVAQVRGIELKYA